MRACAVIKCVRIGWMVGPTMVLRSVELVDLIEQDSCRLSRRSVLPSSASLLRRNHPGLLDSPQFVSVNS